MQTTIQLYETLLAQATELAREQGCDLSHLISETLRDKFATRSPVAPQLIFRLADSGFASSPQRRPGQSETSGGGACADHHGTGLDRATLGHRQSRLSDQVAAVPAQVTLKYAVTIN